jgi:hypothetical protein
LRRPAAATATATTPLAGGVRTVAGLYLGIATENGLIIVVFGHE